MKDELPDVWVNSSELDVLSEIVAAGRKVPHAGCVTAHLHSDYCPSHHYVPASRLAAAEARAEATARAAAEGLQIVDERAGQVFAVLKEWWDATRIDPEDCTTEQWDRWEIAEQAVQAMLAREWPTSEVDKLRDKCAAAEARAEKAERELADLRHDVERHIAIVASAENELAAAREALRETVGALQEMRVRLHASGRRPEECYEMSMIDAAIDAARKGGTSDAD